MAIDNCNIICDLLPSYIDGICSEDTRIEVENHLQTCEQCKRIYNDMIGLEITPVIDEIEMAKVTEPFRKLNTRYHIKVLSCVIAVMIILGLFASTFRPGIWNKDLMNDEVYNEKIYWNSIDKLEHLALMRYNIISDKDKTIKSFTVDHDSRYVYWNNRYNIYIEISYIVEFEDGDSEIFSGYYIGIHYLWGYVKWIDRFN